MRFGFLRSGVAVAAASALALGLIGCSPDEEANEDNSVAPGTDESSSTDEATETAGAEETVQIDFSTWWAYVDEEIIDMFNEQHPEIEVNLQFTAVDGYPQRIQAQASSNDLPDVMSVGGFYTNELGRGGHLLNLQDALATPPYDGDFATWEESFIPVVLDNANNIFVDQQEDTTYTVPFGALSVAVVYNKDIFSEAGIEPPSSFQDMLENCSALRSAGYTPMSLTGQTWIAWLFQLGWDQSLREDAGDFTASNPNFVRAFETVKELADAQCWDASQINTDIEGETALFLQQNTAQFMTVPENFLAAVVDGASFELGSYVLPALSGSTNEPVEPVRSLGGGTNMVAVAANSDQQEAAITFAKFLTSTEVQGYLAETMYTMPSVQMEMDGANEVMQAYIEAGSQGFIAGSEIPAFTAEGRTTFYTEIAPRLILGDLTPAEAAEATEPLLEPTE